GRDMVGGLRRAAGLVGGEGGRSRMAAVAVTGRRVRLVEGLRAGVSPGGRAARDHAYIRRALVTDLAGGDRGRDPGVAGHRERWRREARRGELEATRIDVARRMTARAVAVEAAERKVVARVEI